LAFSGYKAREDERARGGEELGKTGGGRERKDERNQKRETQRYQPNF